MSLIDYAAVRAVKRPKSTPAKLWVGSFRQAIAFRQPRLGFSVMTVLVLALFFHFRLLLLSEGCYPEKLHQEKSSFCTILSTLTNGLSSAKYGSRCSLSDGAAAESK